MTHSRHAQAAGAATPESGEAPSRDESARGFKEQTQDASPDFHSAPHAGQALRVIEGEGKAADYLARLHAQQAGPDELALIVSMMYGGTLRGFCRVIERTLRGRHA